jgi:hypothetical protein
VAERHHKRKSNTNDEKKMKERMKRCFEKKFLSLSGKKI